MNSGEEEFNVGDRVIYTGFYTHEYGVITKITIVVPKSENDGVEVRLYHIAMEDGGVFSSVSQHLQRAP